jgi:trk system potassium uptake protein TrkA
MNIVTIGLGNFGASLSKILTSMGHDVLGVDIDNDKVEFFKDKIANTICLDATDPHTLRLLPLSEADVFIVCVGYDFGVSVKIAALLKKYGVQKIICRESSSIHMTVLKAIGIMYTLNPEYEAAEVLAQKLTIPGILNIFNISDNLKIVDLQVPVSLTGHKLSPSDFRRDTHLTLLALKRNEEMVFSAITLPESREIPDLNCQKDDILVIAGTLKDIRKFIKG